ncbi:uncharacterized protein LOC134829617 [Culicoides brevitarsis]|uniref:uncharacterized protein LOC134829617 n=1 Tax=Culicoides brevitarsis TaxID=469753 RepID=UPI00307B2B28
MELKVLLLIFLSLSLVIDDSQAACNNCGANSGVACISDDQFYPCSNGIPNTSVIQRCPVGQVCTNKAAICVPAATSAPNCLLCNTCTAQRTFTCVNFNTYAPCVNGTIIDWQISCPQGMICNPAGPKENPCTTMTWQQIPRCSMGEENFSTTTTSTTPATTAVPSTWCGGQLTVGNYPNPSDLTCKTYLKCYKSNGVMTGQKYTCPGTTFFNPTSKMCEVGYVCAA